MLSVLFYYCYTERHYAQCRYAECRAVCRGIIDPVKCVFETVRRQCKRSFRKLTEKDEMPPAREAEIKTIFD